ncbi:ataxin-1-like [Alosa pseudoharengus]|uniref:ataxin-1-like n=1 Tax=Alosa pseudoharengus TaxID=34774 RepID=UPI003F893BE0
MKPAHERNQECLPPKKRDLPVNNNNNNSSSSNSGFTGGGGVGPTATAAGGEEATSTQNAGVSSEVQSGAGGGGDWLRAQQQALHCGLEAVDGVAGLPPDQYSMLYKVALPSVSYAPTTLHPVLSHISPAYTVPSSLLQHHGLSYQQLGYAQIPHSSLQFVGSPYAAMPYAVPPGFVPNPLISPQSAIPQPHAVPHLVPYQSVIQESVVSSPPQTQVSAHAYAKVAAAAGGVPLVLSSDQAAVVAAQQQQLGAVGVLSAAELSPRGVPVFYHPPRAQASREALEQERERERDRERDRERELNGGEREQSAAAARELLQDSAHAHRSARLLQEAQQHERSLKNRRPDERASPGQRSTPDTDLEVQQVVGRLASPIQTGSRKEAPHGPLNLSQSSQRSREAHGDGRTVYVPPPVATPADLRVPAHAQQVVPAQPGHHAVILANGQPVLIPLDYHRHAQPQPQQQPHPYLGHPNDAAATAPVASQSPYPKAPEHPAAACLPERAGAPELQQPPQAQLLPAAVALAPVSVPTQAVAPQAPVAGTGPSHFMKGAIIQLATGELKRVEDLQTQDFVRSAEMSGGLKIDSSMVVDVRASQQRPGLVALHFSVGEQQSKVTIDVPPEHPFFVFGQGWSSCSPERTAQLYGLACHNLQVGDVCVSIALQQPPAGQQKAQSQQPQQHHQLQQQPQQHQQQQHQQHHQQQQHQQQHQQQQQQQQQQQHHHQQQQQQQQLVHARTSSKSNSTSGALAQPMGPPAPQHTRPHSQSHFRMERIQRERDRERERERDRERERGEKDEATHVGVLGHGEAPPRPNRTSAEHPRSHSSYYLHTEGHSRHEPVSSGGGGGLALTSSSAAQRRWSAPGSQRYAIKNEEGRMVGPALPGPSRPSFIPQEVKLSIEGRSNAGK